MTQQDPQTPSTSNILPIGDYNAVVTGEVQYGTGAKGEQVAIQLALTMPDGTQRLAWTKLFFSPDAIQYAMERLKTIGWPGGNTLIEKCKDAKCRVRVKHTSYENDRGEQKVGAEVDILTGGGFAMKNPLDEAKKVGFLQRISQYVPPTNGAKGGAPAAGGGYPANWDAGAAAPDDFSLD